MKKILIYKLQEREENVKPNMHVFALIFYYFLFDFALSSAIIYAFILCNSIANCYGILSQTISSMADDHYQKFT